MAQINDDAGNFGGNHPFDGPLPQADDQIDIIREGVDGDIPVTTIDNPEGTGATFSPTFVVLGVTYSNALTDRIRVGFTANLVSEEIQRPSASGVSFDAGVQYDGIGGVEGP